MIVRGKQHDMMVPTTVVIVLFLLVGSISAQVCPSDIGWLKFESRCYRFVAYPELRSREATTFCQDDGATLLSINTEQEHNFIASWLLSFDQRRQSWLTSGVVIKAGIKWGGDGTTNTAMDKWSIPPEKRTEGLPVVYSYSTINYAWNVGNTTTAMSFICEISIFEVYRIRQQHRDFDYGLDLENPNLAPRGPAFIEEPNDTMILGKTKAVFLNCLATGNPEPTYEWLKLGANQVMTPITKTSRYSFTTGRLEISDPRAEDESTYQCRVTNPYGVILSASAQLAFGSLGEFSNVPAASVNGAEYEGAQLECPNINAKPGKSYQWYKNNFMSFIRPNAQTHTFISANGKLFFSELAISDQGIYYCLVTLSNLGQRGNYIGAEQTESRNSLGFNLTVKSGGAKNVQPIIQNDFIYVFPPTPMRGGMVRLECFAYGTSPLVYSWSRANNKPLPRGHKFDSNNRILELNEVELEDGGQYTCRVSSSVTSLADSKSIDLKIQSRPYFTYKLQNQHVDVGSRLTWYCEAQGQPVPTYEWYKNGQVITSTENMVITANSLTIKKLNKDTDNGMYQCAARNRYGTTFSTAQLRVLELAPSFLKNPMKKHMSAAIAGQVTIICNPQAAPLPTYSWTKDGRDLNLSPSATSETDHYRLLANGNLVIQDVTTADQGLYTCKAENVYGTAQDNSNLLVLERTVISQPPSDQKVEVNLTATMLCRASHSRSIDMVYVWTFNDYIIDYELHPEYRRGDGSQQGSLYIIATQYENEGLYTCTATTGMDQISSTAYLTVIGPPGEPAGVYVRLKSLIDNKDLAVQDPVDLANTTRWIVWTDGLDRGSIITHYFVEFRTNFDRRWRVHPDGQNIPVHETMNEQYKDKRFARLTNLKAGAGVEFRVIARNSFGLGAPSLPTTMTQIASSRPSQKVTNVRGGGGSVGDLTIVWDPLPLEDHNGPNLRYKVSWRTYEAGAQSDSSKWRSVTIPHDLACRYEPNYITGLVYLCKYVETVGVQQFYKPYEVQVQAINNVGEGPATPVIQIMSAEDMPMGAPQTVIAAVYNATALLVKWKPVPNDRENVRGKLKGYKINYWRMYNETENEALQNIIELKPGQNNLAQGLIIGLEPFTWYAFNVQAYNGAGNGPKSSSYDQQTLNRAPIQYPTEVHVFSVEGFGVRVNFRGISTQVREEPLKGYKVQYWKQNENILNAVEVDFGKMNTGVIRNLSSSEVYQLRVFGYSKAGQGKRSSPSVYFTVGDGEILINQETTEILGIGSSLRPSVIISLIAVIIISILLS